MNSSGDLTIPNTLFKHKTTYKMTWTDHVDANLVWRKKAKDKSNGNLYQMHISLKISMLTGLICNDTDVTIDKYKKHIKHYFYTYKKVNENLCNHRASINE